MVEHLFKATCIAVYLFILLAVAVYGLHRYVLVYLYLKHRNNGYQPKRRFTDATSRASPCSFRCTTRTSSPSASSRRRA